MKQAARKKPSISTGGGDNGTTSLFGGGRVQKTHPQVVATGDCDELGAAIGLAKAFCRDLEQKKIYEAVQVDLITVMGDISLNRESDLAGKGQAISLDAGRVEWLESMGSDIEKNVPPLRGWDLSGSNPESAALHLARTVCRRAERSVGGVPEAMRASKNTLLYLNRLSDWLWLAARAAAEEARPIL